MIELEWILKYCRPDKCKSFKKIESINFVYLKAVTFTSPVDYYVTNIGSIAAVLVFVWEE